MSVTWEKAAQNDEGITQIAYKKLVSEFGDGSFWREAIVGYNGILKGEKVLYEGKQYTIVMVSRLGDFGLSETGELPYITRVSPTKVTKVQG